jgi:hypothetical protein
MTWLLVGLAVLVVLVILVVAIPQLRSRSLKQRFGPEYDRVVDEGDDRRSAEADLRGRLKRRGALEIRELEPAAREAYAEQWLKVQQRFIDEPEQTVAEADSLVQTVMRERGYPVDEFDERIEMMSVDHPELVDNYRTAHDIQVRSEQQEASTDDLREAFQRYRALFSELLADGVSDTDTETKTETETDDSDDHELPERGAR